MPAENHVCAFETAVNTSHAKLINANKEENRGRANQYHLIACPCMRIPVRNRW